MKNILAIALLLAAPLANANLVSRDLVARDDGLLTLDTSTGLEWLDVSVTKGLSVDAVLAGQGGWLNAGFRFADLGDLGTLFVDGGLQPRPGQELGSKGFLEFMGGTGDEGLRTAALLGPTGADAGSGRLATSGFVAPIPCGGWSSSVCDPSSSTYSAHYTYSVRLQASSNSSNLVVGDNPASTAFHDSNSGNWLVRETSHPVPEPASFALMSLGLAAIGVARVLTSRRLQH